MWRLLEPLRPEDREAFLALTHRRTFARDEVLCHEGDPADSLHLVERGHLAVRGTLPSGAAATFTVLSPGDYFGELALMRTDRRRTATVTALEESQTLAVAGTAFNRLCQNNPDIERLLSTLLADRIDLLSRRLLETLYETLDRRVHRRLLDLADAYGGSDGAVTIPLSQAQLADLVGATRPPVNQVLKRLADRNVVRLGRSRIEVLDRAELRRRST
ncbi:Crp/Fnr family transcriptional regulator [Nocardioides sp. STR2]|uniref:Crp/Fnr family transcriptional regulator n=1 Tax=Nocardioides pini TaxID=2975053 RepID=A0ABT4CEQ0_9ACTN|nr:Crp/Fnr family transcriptional regulator [Nocardioides pini]MCY4726434.1 Crp/Fnr family transcriptional regulator [Nocardioides pini]